VAVFGLGFGSANASVTIDVNVAKDKDVTVTENLTIVKEVLLVVVVAVEALKFAEATALINQVNVENRACTNCAEKSNLIEFSGNDNAGIININQASGNMSNQGSAVSVSVDLRTTTSDGTPLPPAPGSRGFAEALAANEQVNRANRVETVNLFFRDAEIFESFNNNTGIIHANQQVGNMSNQANDVAMAVSFAIGGVALSEALLGQFTIDNAVFESDAANPDNDNPDTGQTGGAGVGIHRTAIIRNSISTNAGIVGVNQSTGNMANPANKVAFAAVILP
jgi:hypothetical protein